MAVTLTFISSSTSSATVESYHNYSAGSRAYWDYRVSGSSSWLNRGYTLQNAYSYQQYTFTGLQPNTYYEFRVRIVNGSNLSELGYDTAGGSTQSNQTPAPTNFSMSGVSETQLYFSWNGVSGASFYDVQIYSPISDSRTEYGSFYWGGLSPNTLYYGQVRAYDSSRSGYSAWTYATGRTLAPPPDTTNPSLSFSTPSGSDVTSSSIYAYAYASDNKELSYFQFYLDNVVKSTQYVSGSYNSADFTFTGLSDNTSYSIKVVVVDASGNSTSVTRVVTTQSGRPTNFSWSTSKVSGQTVNVTVSEWNRLQDKINEFRAWKKVYSQYSKYSYYNGDYSFTMADYGSNNIIMAYHFNQARNAIGDIVSAPASVSSGQEIQASLLNSLVSALNSIN
jgi:Fibronectin type III domain